MATARSVLVVTASSELGERIQHTLEETGLYKVMLVDSDQEALLCIRTVSFTIAILDFDLPGGNILELASTMRQKLPKMRLVVLYTEDDQARSTIAAFQPAGQLRKPFDLPELLDTLDKAILPTNEPSRTALASPRPVEKLATASTPPPPEWLQDVNWAAQQLALLSLESSAQAALIVREGTLWAYAGELPKHAANELAERLTVFWDDAPDRAAQPCEDMVRFLRLDATQGEYMLYATSLGSGMVLSVVFDSDTPFSTIRTQAGYLAKALAMPPGTQLPPHPSHSESVHAHLGGAVLSHFSPSSSLPPLLEDVPSPSPYQSRRTKLDPKQTPAEVADIPAVDTKPVIASDFLQPDTALHYLTYAFTLIPRLPQHQMAGDLARQLHEWMPQLFLAFGWQLLHFGIHAEYLQVIARIGPNTSPGSLVRTIRQQTSRLIFSTFPHLALDNPSGDYWAAGYLILSSAQPPPNPIIQHFIDQTRQQQGQVCQEHFDFFYYESRNLDRRGLHRDSCLISVSGSRFPVSR